MMREAIADANFGAFDENIVRENKISFFVDIGDLTTR